MKNKIGDNRHSVILQDAQVVDIQHSTVDFGQCYWTTGTV